MATLKNRRGNWYARVLWYLDGRKKERQVPLRTGSKVTARERLSEVNKVESDIKDELEIPKNFKIINKKSYGKTSIIFLN